MQVIEQMDYALLNIDLGLLIRWCFLLGAMKLVSNHVWGVRIGEAKERRFSVAQKATACDGRLAGDNVAHEMIVSCPCHVWHFFNYQ